tara:strand:+ start:134 stop:622 length:489 start_codon:yes stop_codon:yes gene_type:complete
MGSGQSVVQKLECPKDYNEEKFSQILRLYDRLDKNGDHVVEEDELKEIAALHLSNRIMLLNKEKKGEEEQKEITITAAKFKEEQKVKELRIKTQNKINEANELLETRKQKIDKTIEKIQQLSDDEKNKAFLRVVSYDNKHIDFWKFFTYMKDKTNDIPNINF